MPPEKEIKQPIVLKEGEVAVDQKTLSEILRKQSDMEQERENDRARMAGLEEMLESTKGASTVGGDKLRERKTFEPAFRTVRLRKYPIAGDPEKLGYVVGWTSRGAYQKVDRTGVSPVMVDYVDVLFLGHERNAEGVLQAEAIPLLDLLNRGEQVHCKIINVEKTPRQVPTGEEIGVSSWDPQHGLVSTGETIDGYVAFTDVKYTIQIPDHAESVIIDGKYVN